MSTFLLSCFLCTLQFGDKFLVVSAHGAFDGFVIQQAFQCFLCRAIVRVAKHLGELLGGELLGQLAETLDELVGASALLSSINQLVVVILSVQVVEPMQLGVILNVKNQVAESHVRLVNLIGARLFAFLPVAHVDVGCADVDAIVGDTLDEQPVGLVFVEFGNGPQ